MRHVDKEYIKHSDKSRLIDSWQAHCAWFETCHYFIPGFPSRQVRGSISVFDVDGGEINQLDLNGPKDEVIALSGEELFLNAKMESGIAHGRIRMNLFDGTEYTGRIIGARTASLFHDFLKVSLDNSCFFPVHFSAEGNPILVALNTVNSDAVLKVRLYLHNRMPEVLVDIPAGGSRLIDLKHHFAAFSECKDDMYLSAYVRLTLKHGSDLRLQILDVSTGVSGTNEIYVAT